MTSVEFVSTTETVAAADRLSVVKNIGNNKLADNSEGRCEKTAMPIALETNLVVNIVEIGDAALCAIIDIEGELQRCET